MYRHRINPRRTAQGTVIIASATNTAVAGLFNNSTTHRLAVWSVGIFSSGSAQFAGTYVQQGHLSNLVGTGTVIWTNQGAIEGQLYKDDLASPATVTGGMNTAFAGGFTFDNVPYWVLDPGWSLVAVAGTAATAFFCGFMWESLSSFAFPPFVDAYDDMGPDFSS